MSEKKFKEGDVVTKVRGATFCGLAELGKQYTVTRDNSGSLAIAGTTASNSCHCIAEWELVKTNNYNNMDLLQMFRLSMKGEPEKTLIKAGIIDNDEKFTSMGKELFNAFLLKKFGADFKTEIVDPIVAEMEKAAK